MASAIIDVITTHYEVVGSRPRRIAARLEFAVKSCLTTPELAVCRPTASSMKVATVVNAACPMGSIYSSSFSATRGAK
jgi:hypothetical protein